MTTRTIQEVTVSVYVDTLHASDAEAIVAAALEAATVGTIVDIQTDTVRPCTMEIDEGEDHFTSIY